MLPSGNNGNTLHPTITKVSTAQMDGRSNSHAFANIKMFAYIRPVKFNVQIINSSKAPENVFGLVIIKIPKTSTIIPLWSSYYMPQNPQNTISQTLLKNYDQFRIVITEALIWVKMTTDTGMKLKVETIVK